MLGYALYRRRQLAEFRNSLIEQEALSAEAAAVLLTSE
jgi:hypothetical protein